MSTTSNYEWFIEPLNQLTNEAIASYLNADMENTVTLSDTSGKIHNCYRLTWGQIAYIHKMRHSFMSFQIYNREKKHGPIRVFTLLGKKKKSKKVIQAQKDLKKLQKK